MEPGECREHLYDVLSDSSRPLEARVDETIELGTEYLGLPIGFLTRIEDGTQEIVQATGDHEPIQPGETCPLEDAYCRRTVELDTPLAIQDVGGSSAITGTAQETFGLESYIGARVIVNDETYGTICFAGTETRNHPFSDSESYFVELAARLIGQALGQQTYERELDEREAEIKRKEEVYRAVVNASFDLVFQIDSEGQFTYVSPNVADLLGYSADEYLGQPFTDMLPDQETVEVAEEVYEAVLAGETVERDYFPLQHRSNERVLVDVRVTPLFSADVSPEDRTPADIIGVQGMARDARGRHRSQRLIRVLNRVLRHNLRNDMNVINGYAETLRESLTGTAAEQAQKIGETSERLIALAETARKIDENLDSPPEIDRVDIVPTVVQAANQVEERYPGASVTVTTPETAMAKSAPRLEAAVWELLDNAANHAGEEPSIEVSVRESDERTIIRIEDDGPGLPKQEQAVLLSGDETPLAHGSGLGLWLVYWVIESLDGKVTMLESEGGTCIEIGLSRTVDTPAPDASEPI